jgi:hypothetical protein
VYYDQYMCISPRIVDVAMASQDGGEYFPPDRPARPALEPVEVVEPEPVEVVEPEPVEVVEPEPVEVVEPAEPADPPKSDRWNACDKNIDYHTPITPVYITSDTIKHAGEDLILQKTVDCELNFSDPDNELVKIIHADLDGEIPSDGVTYKYNKQLVSYWRHVTSRFVLYVNGTRGRNQALVYASLSGKRVKECLVENGGITYRWPVAPAEADFLPPGLYKRTQQKNGLFIVEEIAVKKSR